MLQLEYRPCAIEHLALINPQGGEHMEREKAYFLQPGFHYIVEDNFAMSAWAGMKCVFAAGIIGIYNHKGTAWALAGKEAGPYMRQITRKVRDALDLSPYERIEMLVDYEFKAGHQWAKMLGFTVDAPRMIKNGIYGNDETLYVRIK